MSRRALLGGLLLLLPVGCAGSGTNRAELVPEGTAVIRVGDAGLQSEVELVSGRAFYEGDLLAAEAQVRNHSSTPERVDYRFSWHHVDDQGVEVGAWSVLTLPGHQERSVSDRAAEPNIVRCEFELRRPTGN